LNKKINNIKMNIQEYLLTLGIETKLLLGGIIGTIAGIKGQKGGWLTKTGTIFTGIGGAIYLTPLAADILDITDERSCTGIAVLIGYVGITGMQKILVKKLDEWKQ
jgi:hypothetical protein